MQLALIKCRSLQQAVTSNRKWHAPSLSFAFCQVQMTAPGYVILGLHHILLYCTACGTLQVCQGFYVPCTDLWVYSTGTAPPGCETTCTCTLRLSGSMRRMTASRVWHRTQGPSHSPAFTLHTCTKLFRRLAYVKSVMCGFVPV